MVVSTNPRDRWLKSDVNVCGTITKKGGKDAPFVVAMCPTKRDTISENVAPTLIKSQSFPTIVSAENSMRNLYVRFLTPGECAKLQGFPEDWGGIKKIDESEFPFWRNVWNEYAEALGKKPRTDAQVRKWLDKPYRESKEYEMWGNGVTLPCVEYIMNNIAEVGR